MNNKHQIRINSVLFGSYQFRCRLIKDAILPHYKGSTIRGLFGRALRGVVCVLRSARCDECGLNRKCLYTRVFETGLALESRDKRIPHPPHPFVIEPPPEENSYFKQDSSFEFKILLFGEVNYQIPYIIYAIHKMGEIGIGKAINGERGRFVLEEVKQGETLIYSRHKETIDLNSPIPSVALKDNEDHPDGEIRLNIRFLTPFRVKFLNRLEGDLPFHVLVRAMLRRVSSIFNQYGEGEPALDYRGLVQRAYQVRVIDSGISWYDWRRYSSRQDRSMLMGGITGAITYQGLLGEYISLIELCSKFHIGKQTSFGLGKYEYSIE